MVRGRPLDLFPAEQQRQIPVWKVPDEAAKRSRQSPARRHPHARDRRVATCISHEPAAESGVDRWPVAGEIPVVQDFDLVLPGTGRSSRTGSTTLPGKHFATTRSSTTSRFFDFTRRRTVDLGTLPGNIDAWVGGLTVSSDRQAVLYSQRIYQSSEVMLVEHFR